MKRQSFALGITAVALMAAGSLYLVSCGSDTNPDLASNESLSELSSAAVTGTVSGDLGGGGNGNGGAAFNEYKRTWQDELRGFLTPVMEAKATTACPTWENTASGGAAASACSASGAVATFTYSSCYFQNKSGSFGTAAWNGSKIFTFGGGITSVSCGAFPSLTTGNTENITFGASTTQTVTASKGATSFTHVITYDTTNPSGFTTTKVAGGGKTLTLGSTAGVRTLTWGIHITSTRSGTTKKGKSFSATAWDHTLTTSSVTVGSQTLNSSAPGITVTQSPAGTPATGTTWTVTGSNVILHNILKIVGVTTHNSVVYQYGQKHPCSGSTTTQLFDQTGTSIGSETLTYTACGSATLTLTGSGSPASAGATSLQHST